MMAFGAGSGAVVLFLIILGGILGLLDKHEPAPQTERQKIQKEIWEANSKLLRPESVVVKETSYGRITSTHHSDLLSR